MSISAPFIRRPMATALADGGHRSARRRRPTRCFPSPRCRTCLPDNHRDCAVAGRRPADDGVLGGDAARKAVRSDTLSDADDLHEFAGLHADHPAIRAERRHQLRGDARADGDQCRVGPVAEGHAHAADLSRDEPGRRADSGSRHDLGTLPITTVDDYAESILAQKLSQVPGVGLVSIGGEQHPSIRISSIRRSWRRSGSIWRTCTTRWPTSASISRKAPCTVTRAPTPCRRTIRFCTPQDGTIRSSPSATAGRSGFPMSARP